MQDFAALLVDARTRARLTQAQLAVSAGLTPSYLSFIENRKKPPPSDDVCRRLAKVLGIPEKTVLEIAHMERAPEALRKRLSSLTHTLKKERGTRTRLLKSLLSPFLFAGPPGFRESAVDALGISPARRRRMKEVLAAVGRSRQDREKEVSRIVDELPERERNQLLEKLPEMLGRDRASASHREPTLRYAPPGADEIVGGAYRLMVTADVASEAEELTEGDAIVVDPRVRPGLDDLLVLRGAEDYHVRRLEASGEGFRLSPGDDETLTADELSARLDQLCAGTVIEVRRPLRRRDPNR